VGDQATTDFAVGAGNQDFHGSSFLVMAGTSVMEDQS
jgi:hypothetical protein